MPLERFTEILRTRWRTVLAVWLTVVAAAGLGALLLSPQYRATVSVMVEPRTPDPIVGLPSPTGMPNHIPTEIDVVQSDRIARTAIRILGLQQDASWMERWRRTTEGRGDFEAWMAAQLLRDLDVRPSRESNVLTISFSSKEPENAARIANAFMQAYIQNSAELRREPARQQNAYFDDSAKALRAELERSQARLAAYQQQHGLVVGTDERLDVENLRLAELSSRVVALQSASTQAAERRRQADTNGQRLGDVQRDPAVFALMTDVGRQESRLTELSSRLGDQHPNVIEARQLLAQLRGRLAETSRRAAQGIGIESRMADDNLAQAERALSEQRAKILALKQERDRAQVLQREVDNAQRAFDAVLTRSSQTSVEAGTLRQNVSVLQAATAPPFPAWPHHWLSLVASGVIGLLLGLMAALWRESREPRLHTADDVATLLGQSLLVTLPDSAARRRPALLPAPGTAG